MEPSIRQKIRTIELIATYLKDYQYCMIKADAKLLLERYEFTMSKDGGNKEAFNQAMSSLLEDTRELQKRTYSLLPLSRKRLRFFQIKRVFNQKFN